MYYIHTLLVKELHWEEPEMIEDELRTIFPLYYFNRIDSDIRHNGTITDYVCIITHNTISLEKVKQRFPVDVIDMKESIEITREDLESILDTDMLPDWVQAQLKIAQRQVDTAFLADKIFFEEQRAKRKRKLINLDEVPSSSATGTSDDSLDLTNSVNAKLNYSSDTGELFFSKLTGMQVDGEYLTDESMARSTFGLGCKK